MSPYLVSEYEEGTAYFVTDKGAEYLVNFIEETNIGIKHAYQLVLSNKNRSKILGTDPKIAETIAAIVTSFFYNKQHVLFYVCDTTDKHEAARHRKFKSWFQKYADTESLELLTERIEVEETTFFISFIYNKKHEEAAALQSSFYSYFQELRSKLE